MLSRGMFSRQYRKVKVIFGLSDLLLTSLAFVGAYQTRFLLNSTGLFHWVFYIDFPYAPLLLMLSAVCWVALGYWLNVYDKLDSARPRTVLRDTFRQCALGAVALVIGSFCCAAI